MSLKDVIGVYKDATLASDVIGHEAALRLKYWVWFYWIPTCVVLVRHEKQRKYLGKEMLVFVYRYGISFCVEQMFVGSILNRTAYLPMLDEDSANSPAKDEVSPPLPLFVAGK